MLFEAVYLRAGVGEGAMVLGSAINDATHHFVRLKWHASATLFRCIFHSLASLLNIFISLLVSYFVDVRASHSFARNAHHFTYLDEIEQLIPKRFEISLREGLLLALYYRNVVIVLQINLPLTC